MSVGYAVKASVGRIVSSELELIYTPRNSVLHSKRGVLLFHGYGHTAQTWNARATDPGKAGVIEAIAQAGYPMAAIYLGGDTFGNSVSTADIDLARTQLGTLEGWATDKLILLGSSEGGISALNYARNHPSNVAGLILVMPLSDLDDARDNNRAGVQAAINTAWGMPGGSTSGSNPLPSDANPNTTANAALIAGVGASNIKMYYSTADTTIIPSTVTSLGTKLGLTPTVISGAQDHGDTLFGLVPVNEIIAFIASRQG